MKFFFWLCVFLLVYHLFLYGFILNIYNRLFRRRRLFPSLQDEALPTIDVVCAAFNEERVLEEKIMSFLALDYPQDKIRMFVISDDSTDRTNEIVQRFADRNVELIIQKPRAGKQSAHNMVIPMLKADFVLSTDANSIFKPNAVRLLANAILSDPRMGLASGRLFLLGGESGDSGEGLYWRYESWLKQQDSDFYSSIVSNGSLFLIRRDLFLPIDRASADDFERALTTLRASYLNISVPEANVSEPVTEHATEEIGRKIRIITQEWNALARNRELLNFFKHPQVCFMLISHKIMRWLFFVMIVGIFITSLFLSDIPFYRIVFGLQLFGYLLGMIELALQKRKKHIPGAGLPAYFVGMFYASVVAFKNFLGKKNFGTWNPIR